MMMSASDSAGPLIFDISDEPVMKLAMGVFERFEKVDRIKVRGRGDSIPGAVAVANIITENFMRGKVIAEDIRVDSEALTKMGATVSTIEIILAKS